MTLVAFPHRSPEPARTVAALATLKMSRDPRCDITVRKDERSRRYTIVADAPGHWVAEIWYGPARHGRRAVFGVHDARMLVSAFIRELADLLRDGWTECARTAPDAN